MTEQGATYCREIFPVRQWISRHYKKIKGLRLAYCNYCLESLSFHSTSSLLDHLVQEHSNKLTEEEKKDKHSLWIWDYLTIKDTQYITCNICGHIIRITERNANARSHLQPPCVDVVDYVGIDAHANTTIKNDQIHSATCSKNTEQISVPDRNVENHVLDLSLPRNVENDVLDLSVHKDI